jgi:hypothetical protein
MRVFAPQAVATDTPAGKHQAVVRRSLPMPLAPVSAMHSDGALLQRKPNCACGGGCPSCQQDPHPDTIQTKLQISTPGDQYEQEADQLSDQVMRMSGDEVGKPTPTLITKGIQRQVSDPDIEEEMEKALKETGAIVQRQVNQGEKLDKDDGEGKPLQAETARGNTRSTSTDLVASLNSLKDGGQPLSLAARSFMEPRFGQDFSHVRVHTDSTANKAAQALNAHAFTVGPNVAFAAGQYAPETSVGQRLLAHELSHVLQQSDQPRIQRKIIVGGKPYTPTKKYYAYLDAQGLGPMKEFIETMHNSGKPPDFSFASFEQMGTEVRVRNQITKGIDAAHAGGSGTCDYPDSAHPDHLDSTYWERKGWMNFVPKSPLPAGKEASDAIDAIFAPGAGSRLECMAMTVAVEYYSLLKGLGKEKFNKLFPGGAGLEISTRLTTGTHPTFYNATTLYKVLIIGSKSEILPGDWVYFKNFKDYPAKNPGGAWRGENAIYMGGGMYRGFGVKSQSEADLNAELVRVYNKGLKPGDKVRTVPDLLAEGGGLQLAPVYRPDIAKLAP